MRGATVFLLQGFQGCDEIRYLNRPKSVEDLVRIVRQYDKVQAVGTGLSWNKEMVWIPSLCFICACKNS